MKALVLAAGRGTRLRPLTDNRPKPMIEVGGIPVLQWNLEALSAAQVRSVVINLHYRPEVITSYFGNGAALGLEITYSYESVLLGTAGAASHVAHLLRDDDFIVAYGDNFSTIDLSKLIDVHRVRQADFTMALFRREDVRYSGVAEVKEDGRITRFIEKPSSSITSSHLVNAGYYVVKPWILDLIQHDRLTDFGRDVLPLLLTKNARIYSYLMTEDLWWIDSIADYERAIADFARRAKT